MISARALLMAACLAALALSGCTDAEPAATDDEGDPAHHDGMPMADTFEAGLPEWHVGRYFGHHIFFGVDDTEGSHINTIVHAASGNSYELGTDDQETAEFHALFDFPILGTFGKDLSTTSFGGDFDLYDFPITDGKRWTGRLTVEQDQFGNGISRDVDLVATFNPEIRVVVSGNTYPGFDIVGTTDGQVLVETNYIPEIGWYGEFVYHDLESESPDDFMFRVISMGYGHDYGSERGGVVYDVTANEILNHQSVSVPIATQVQPPHQETFTVSADASKLMGIVFAFAAGGHSEVDLVTPSNELIRMEETTDVPSGADPNAWGSGHGDLYTIPFEVGDWQYLNWHAGFAAGGGAQIWELSETQIIL